MGLYDFKNIICSGEDSIICWLHDVKKQGLGVEDTAELTKVMNELSRNNRISWDDNLYPKVDLPSTGGIGNITPIVVSILVAATGKVYVPKVSTRSLTHTGGTIDILESVGYNAKIPINDFKENIRQNHISILAHDEEYTPLDSKLLKLRKETGTIGDPNLTASSIINNKWIFGLNVVLLDCKVGKAGRVKDEKEGEKLAKAFILAGESVGITTGVALTYNEYPQSMCIGNKVCLYEIIQILKGKGEKRIRNLCIDLAAHLLLLAKRCNDFEACRKEVEDTIKNGQALNTFKTLLEAHCVNGIDLCNPESLLSCYRWVISVDKDGIIGDINGQELNEILRSIIFCDERICDYDAGVYFHKRVGDKVKKGEPIMTLYMSHDNPFFREKDEILNKLKNAISVDSSNNSAKQDNFLLKFYTREIFNMMENYNEKNIVVCNDGKVWKGEIERVSCGSYVWLETSEGAVVLVWNEHWKKWNIIGGHWEKQEDGTDKDGNPDYLKTAKRELIEELGEFADIKASEEDFTLENIGLAEYMAYSERAKRWTKYYHRLYCVIMPENIENELKKKIWSGRYCEKVKVVSKEKLLPNSEFRKNEPVANTIDIFITLFPQLISKEKCKNE